MNLECNNLVNSVISAHLFSHYTACQKRYDVSSFHQRYLLMSV